MGEKGLKMPDQIEEFLTPAMPEKHQEIIDPVEEPKPEPAVEVPAPAAAPPEIEGLKQAMIAERRRRQELEQALAQKQEEEKPFLGEEYEARFKETETKFQHELVKQKLDLSESFAREKYTDFGDKLEIFSAMVTENPALYQQMIQQANPAEFAYKTATNQQKLKEMGDPTQYENKLREQITAELEAKYKAQLEAELKKKTELPGSLATARGATGNQTPAWQGPTSLDDMLNNL